jgi:hypothetical protein
VEDPGGPQTVAINGRFAQTFELYRVENLPVQPTCTQIVYNYLFSAGILIKLLANVHVTLFMLVLKNGII